MRLLLRRTFVALVLTMYAILAPFGYFAFYLWSLIPPKNPVKRARVLLAIQQRAFRLVHWTARTVDALDYEPKALRHTLPSRPSILVANHPTLTDTTAILATFPRTVTIVKPAIFHRWWLKPLFVRSGFIESPGADYERLPQILDEIETRLAQGFHVLIFPEGTRSPAGEIRTFGRTAFESACRAKAPIVPIAIDCQPLWLSKETPFMQLPPSVAKLRLHVLPAIEPEDFGFQSRPLRDAVRQQIVTHLQASPPILS